MFEIRIILLYVVYIFMSGITFSHKDKSSAIGSKNEIVLLLSAIQSWKESKGLPYNVQKTIQFNRRNEHCRRQRIIAGSVIFATICTHQFELRCNWFANCAKYRKYYQIGHISTNHTFIYNKKNWLDTLSSCVCFGDHIVKWNKNDQWTSGWGFPVAKTAIRFMSFLGGSPGCIRSSLMILWTTQLIHF